MATVAQPNERAPLLLEMLRCALLDIRILARNGHAQQASDLADAFHNLPAGVFRDGFDVPRFRDGLIAYARAYPDPTTRRFDYVAMLDQAGADSAGG